MFIDSDRKISVVATKGNGCEKERNAASDNFMKGENRCKTDTWHDLCWAILAQLPQDF